MKRSTLKRGSSTLARRTKLRQGSKSLARSSMKRGESKLSRGKRLRQVGRRAKREAPAWRAAKREVLERAGGCCERCGARKLTLDVHHLLSRARGGGHTAENCAAICRECHDTLTFSNPPDAARWVLSKKGAVRT